MGPLIVIGADRLGRLIACLLVCIAVPVAAAPRTTIALDNGWQVRIDPADGDAVKAHPAAARWLAATVPGSVQQDLIAAGIVPDPFVGVNEAGIQWVGLTGWQYRRTIDVSSAMLARGHLDLVFDGLDTFARVAVNGTPLIVADNAHRRWRTEAKSLLHVGANTITIAFASPIKMLQPMVLAQKNPLPGEYDYAFGDEPKGRQTSPYIRKPKYQYGWDWGPRIVTIGPWRMQRLVMLWQSGIVEQRRVETAVRFQEDRADVEIGDARIDAVGARQIAVDRIVRRGFRIRDRAGQDPQQQYLRVGQPHFQIGDDRVDPAFGVDRGPPRDAGIVGSDQQHGDLWMQPRHLAVLQAPQHVRRGVAAEAKIERLARCVEGLPGRLEILVGQFGLVVIVGDRIADQDHFLIGMRGDRRQDRRVPVTPPTLHQPVGRRYRGIGHDGRRRHLREREGRGEGAQGGQQGEA